MNIFSFAKWDYILSLPKTLIFNFTYFPFRVAVRLPVLISHRVILKKISGSVVLGRVKTGIVKIGFDDVPLFDCKRGKGVLVISGKIVFEGSAWIGPGCQLGVSGEMTCGDNFVITAYSLISAKKKIAFGKNVMISWDVLVIDHDWHDIFDDKGLLLNPAKPIIIGDNVWVCCRSLILKGCHIANGIIVAAGTTVTGSVAGANSIIGDNVELRVLKDNIFWKA
jgi:acetyltransferase-like isoleucine patch superfamily enzyme